MKTFRLIGMALLAVVMCLNFTSCSDDDNEEPERNDDGIVTNQKRLVRIYNNDAGECIHDCIYDSKGRLSTMFYYNNTFNYTWGDGTITEIFEYNNGRDQKTTTFSINRNNNLIRSLHEQNKNATFSYNSSNQLIELKDLYSTRRTFTWEKDRIVKVVENYKDNDNITIEYTYSGKSCKGYFPLYDIFIRDGVSGGIIYAHPELIGLRCTQLPDQRINRSGNYESIDKYTYTFDKDGYIESFTIENRYLNVYTFTWE